MNQHKLTLMVAVLQIFPSNLHLTYGLCQTIVTISSLMSTWPYQLFVWNHHSCLGKILDPANSGTQSYSLWESQKPHILSSMREGKTSEGGSYSSFSCLFLTIPQDLSVFSIGLTCFHLTITTETSDKELKGKKKEKRNTKCEEENDCNGQIFFSSEGRRKEVAKKTPHHHLKYNWSDSEQKHILCYDPDV